MTISSLQEALKILESQDKTFESVKDLLEYTNIVDQTGANIFNRQSDDYTLGMLSILQSFSISFLISQGNYPAKECLALINEDKNGVISAYSALLMKLAVGMAALEELH